MGRWWASSASPAWASPACATSSLVPCRRQGCADPRGQRRAYGQATPYLPIVDLLKAYFQLEPGTTSARYGRRSASCSPWIGPRADRPAVLALLDVPVEDRSGRPSIRPNAASAPWSPQAPAAAGEPGPAPAPGRREPALDRHRDPGVPRQPGRAVCRPPACSSSSTIAPSTSMAGGARPTIPSSGSTPCPPTSAQDTPPGASWETMPSLEPLKQRADRADRREPVLPGGERPDPGGERRSWSASRGPTAWPRHS